MSKVEPDPIPPRSEWRELSINQLYDAKSKMQDKYYGLRQIGASFANQFKTFVDELEALIQRRHQEAQDASRDEDD